MRWRARETGDRIGRKGNGQTRVASCRPAETLRFDGDAGLNAVRNKESEGTVKVRDQIEIEIDAGSSLRQR